MTMQEFIAKGTKDAGDSLFRTVRAMPEDKLNWKPAETSRSALDQLQECAQAVQMFIAMVKDHKAPDFSPELYEKAKEVRKQWDTVDKCEKVFWENTNAFIAAIRDVRDEDLGIQITIPFGKGWVATLAEVMNFHVWNLTYHVGQINYIQTLYGDMDMH